MSDAGSEIGLAHQRANSLEDLLAALCGDPGSRGRLYNKAELIDLLGQRYAGDSAAAFDHIRTVAKGSGVLGTTAVRTEGERRGVRYGFETHDAAPVSPRIAPIAEEKSPRPALGGLRDFPAPECPAGSGKLAVHQGDNLQVIRGFPDRSFDLIYIDPPFNTGRVQARTRIKTERDEGGDRVGFQGQRYKTTTLGSSSYADSFDDYMAFLIPRLEEAYRLLKPTGSFFLHLDFREVHYAKVALDAIFGRDSFINEIIWSYDYGARATDRWSPKHDNILWYAKTPGNYCFNYDEIDRIPYMAPSLVGEEKAARGKTPTDTWWNTIVSPNGKEKTGYPTQKPLAVLTRIVRVHSRPGDRLLDFFAGSGSFGEAGASFGRHVTLIDASDEAIAVMRRRFGNYEAQFVAGPPSLSDDSEISPTLTQPDECGDSARSTEPGAERPTTTAREVSPASDRAVATLEASPCDALPAARMEVELACASLIAPAETTTR